DYLDEYQCGWASGVRCCLKALGKVSRVSREVGPMAWKTITTQLSNPRRAEVLLSVAGRLAERFEGHLIGIDATPAFAFASPVFTPADVDAIIAADEARTAEVRAIFETAATNRAFVAEWRELKLTNVDL